MMTRSTAPVGRPLAVAVALAAVAMLLVAALGSPAAEAAVTEVWTYNDNYTAGDSGCEYAVWKIMGFVQADGSLGSIVGTDIIVDGQDKGDVVAPGRFLNADGTQEAFDLSDSTFATAYGAVKDTAGGRLTVCAHGIKGGGGIKLDGGNLYEGFGAGTGIDPPVTTVGPYPDLPAATAAITVHLHTCLSETDPDGGGPKTSVVTSLQGDIGGNATVTGHSGLTTPQQLLIEESLQGELTGVLCENCSDACSAVGGILEDPDVEALPSEAADSSGGLSAGVIAGIAGVAAAAIATTTGGFALWRRRIR